MITFLEKLGLSEKEAKVYLAALELGASSVQEIGKKAGVNRATTYFILESLAKLGLTSSYEKDKKTFFTAEAPEQLDNLLKRQEENIEDSRVELKKNIPELHAIFNLAVGKPKVKFYEGIEGIKVMHDEALKLSKSNDKTFAFTPLDLYEESYASYADQLVDNRANKKIFLNVIYTHKDGPKNSATNVKLGRIARFVPRDKFPFNSMINIIPPKFVRLYIYKPNPAGITIEDEQITKTWKSIFDLSWEAAEKYNK